MLKAVFFDLDGTLLPMDQDRFVKSYMGRMAKKMAPHGYDPDKLIKAVWTGTAAMVKNDGTRTNEEVFWCFFREPFGQNVRKDEPLFEDFYRSEFQQVRRDCGFDPRAAATVRAIRDMGLRVVLATNPLFPPIATQSRVRWAGLEPNDFEFITTYDNSSFCKPNPEYYREILGKLDLKPEQCLMVGNDVTEDMVAGTLGMQVFLLTDCLINKQNVDISVYPHGSFPGLLNYVRSL
ncbi:MAG: HAD family hydrolase [Eubacteriales bacterium]|nr:HAD family hydrolase [Eubacteriales bacterium]